jgi:hypothetical protein
MGRGFAVDGLVRMMKMQVFSTNGFLYPKE